MESIARTPRGSVDQGCSLTDPMSSLVWSLAPIKYPVIRHTGARAGGATVLVVRPKQLDYEITVTVHLTILEGIETRARASYSN
jgi:hypothetical protein